VLHATAPVFGSDTTPATQKTGSTAK